eukprot:CAMPEP_0174305676 /NCGR_PEP_ID=MMETSP0809-20121228/61548_1 /TAXON_ID=73025 ORGANISM="Eutreptiella gymnastica-like, Strain CCMP1594" /NCGR_SAMPLE_ID=MMETSP0809 /ASSEMBLY_ACC=CAM_ASM_000658 /LENGTH=56 /DNA_ID=CAMNT_0015412189 /DNA_START=21 /DNA_END=191 /DNA_ORIENTATION=+
MATGGGSSPVSIGLESEGGAGPGGNHRSVPWSVPWVCNHVAKPWLNPEAQTLGTAK